MLGSIIIEINLVIKDDVVKTKGRLIYLFYFNRFSGIWFNTVCLVLLEGLFCENKGKKFNIE